MCLYPATEIHTFSMVASVHQPLNVKALRALHHVEESARICISRERTEIRRQLNAIVRGPEGSPPFSIAIIS
jgi:hypothetical protein